MISATYRAIYGFPEYRLKHIIIGGFEYGKK